MRKTLDYGGKKCYYIKAVARHRLKSWRKRRKKFLTSDNGFGNIKKLSLESENEKHLEN